MMQIASDKIGNLEEKLKHLSVFSTEIAQNMNLGIQPGENNACNGSIKKRDELIFQGQILKNWINT